MNRSLLLVVGVVLVAALVAGDAVYKSHQQRLSEQPGPVSGPAPATAAPAAGAAAPGNASTAPATSAAAAPSESAQPAAPPETPSQTRKLKAPPASPAPLSGPSEAEIQAQQQALLEQKRLLDAMETESDQLHGRAASVDSSLNALEQQMHNSGVGLRGDMVAARNNLHNDLDKAVTALNSGDTERARHFLDLAQRETEKLEAFLGRR